MAFLSDAQKQHIIDILKRWDELGHAPSHSEFNSDPKVTNAIASSFGSYALGLEQAKYFHEHPEQQYRLYPPPPEPPKTEEKGGKRRKKSTKATQVVQEQPKPLEQSVPLKVGETRIIPKVALKTPLTAPEESKPEPEEFVVTPIEEIVPEEPVESEPAPSEPMPEITPIREPELEPDPEPADKPASDPETEVIEEPLTADAEEKSIEADSEEIPEEPEEEPAIVKEVTTMSQNNQKIINLTGKTVRLVSKEQLRKALNGVMPDVSPLEDGGTATVMKASVDVDSYIFEAEDDLIEIPIVSVYGQPSLIKDKALHSFPEPKEGVLLLVSYEVIEAARDFGRDTDDLVYLIEYEKHNNCIYGRKLGRI